MRRSWKRPRRKAIPARWPACAATDQRSFRSIEAAFSKALMRRATLSREWLLFLEKYPVLLIPVSGELPFPDQSRSQGRGLLRPGLARAIDANRYSLHGPAWANGRNRTGGPHSRRRAGRSLPLSRGSLPARGRGDRSGRNAAFADRSGRLEVQG